MYDKESTILVPWDFSEVANYALEHAIQFAKITSTTITLINIVKKDKDIADTATKMDVVIEDTSKKYNIRPLVIVKVGSIFKTITETANESSTDLVIMGTHGIKGMQKYTGSWALKVIAGTNVPFVVVQAPPQNEQFQNIVFPVDFRAENKEKLRWANYLSAFYKTKIHICKVDNFTDELLKRKAKSNFIYAKNFLNEKGIDYEITTLEGKNTFADETIEFAQQVKASMILIMTTKDISFQDYVLGANEQKIIANSAKIPVMCVNPKDLKKSGYFR